MVSRTVGVACGPVEELSGSAWFPSDQFLIRILFVNVDGTRPLGTFSSAEIVPRRPEIGVHLSVCAETNENASNGMVTVELHGVLMAGGRFFADFRAAAQGRRGFRLRRWRANSRWGRSASISDMNVSPGAGSVAEPRLGEDARSAMRVR